MDSNILARSAVDAHGCHTLVRRCIEWVKVQVELLVPYGWRATYCSESSECWYAIGGRRYRLVQNSVSLDVAVIVSAGYIASAGARRSELVSLARPVVRQYSDRKCVAHWAVRKQSVNLAV